MNITVFILFFPLYGSPFALLSYPFAFYTDSF